MSRYQEASQPTSPRRVWIGRRRCGAPARMTWRVTTNDSSTMSRDNTNGGNTARARTSVANPTIRDRVGIFGSAARRHARREPLQAWVFEDAIIWRNELGARALRREQCRERGADHGVGEISLRRHEPDGVRAGAFERFTCE